MRTRRTLSVLLAAAFGTALAAPALATVSNGLLAHLPFDGALNDASGNGLNFTGGTPTGSEPGVGYGAGYAGAQAMALSSNGYAFSFAPQFQFGTATNFSFSFWTKTTQGNSSFSGDPSYISNKAWASGSNIGYVVATDGDGRIQWNYREYLPPNRAASPSRSDYDSPGNQVSTNEWVHIAVTFTRNLVTPLPGDTPLVFGVASTYVNGVRINRSLMNNSFGNIDGFLGDEAPADPSQFLPTVIGNDGTGNYGDGSWNANYTDAFIDDMGIWNRALTPAEVALIFNAGSAGLASFSNNVWASDASGDWTTPGSWTGTVPNAVDAVANLGTVITTARTVNIGSAVTIGAVNFDALNAGSYTVSGTGTVTLQTSSGPATITAARGSHALTANLNIASDAILGGPGDLALGNVANSAALSVSTDVTAGDISGTGDVTVEAGRSLAADSIRQDALTIRAIAEVALNSGGGVSRMGGLDLARDGSVQLSQLDLGDNAMIVDYSAAEASPAAELAAAILSGYAGGAWNAAGIVSSAAGGAIGVGYAEASDLGLSSFEGESVDSTTFLLKTTFNGDTNLDGKVDVTDLGNLASAWQSAGAWSDGDSNYDGTIDVSDLGSLATNWQAGVESPAAPSATFENALRSVGLGAVVPEPSILGLAGLALLGARRRR